jgi:hypothetical protein
MHFDDSGNTKAFHDFTLSLRVYAGMVPLLAYENFYIMLNSLFIIDAEVRNAHNFVNCVSFQSLFLKRGYLTFSIDRAQCSIVS